MYDLVLDWLGITHTTGYQSVAIQIAGAAFLLCLIWFLDSLRKIFFRR